MLAGRPACRPDARVTFTSMFYRPRRDGDLRIRVDAKGVLDNSVRGYGPLRRFVPVGDRANQPLIEVDLSKNAICVGIPRPAQTFTQNGDLPPGSGRFDKELWHIWEQTQ